MKQTKYGRCDWTVQPRNKMGLCPMRLWSSHQPGKGKCPLLPGSRKRRTK